MAGRPRHPRKELEHLIKDYEGEGWVFVKDRKYYKGRCLCGLHQKWVKVTPSDPNYEKNVRGWFKRNKCHNDDRG